MPRNSSTIYGDPAFPGFRLYRKSVRDDWFKRKPQSKDCPYYYKVHAVALENAAMILVNLKWDEWGRESTVELVDGSGNVVIVRLVSPPVFEVRVVNKTDVT